MIEIVQALSLALIQGLTEFLPISSSAHLILLSQFAGWSDQGVVLDIAAHVGTLFAVVWYFRAHLMKLIKGEDRHMLAYIVVSAVPLGICGLLFAGLIEFHLRSATVIAAASVFFGIALWWSQRHAASKDLSWRVVVYMSVAQCLALIPGASRSGVTMTAGMWAGLAKSQAASFSFLMAIPAIGMTALYGFIKIVKQPEAVAWMPLLIVVFGSFIAAYVCIHFFMKWIERIDFVWFMHYRWILAVLIWVAL